MCGALVLVLAAWVGYLVALSGPGAGYLGWLLGCPCGGLLGAFLGWLLGCPLGAWCWLLGLATWVPSRGLVLATWVSYLGAFLLATWVPVRGLVLAAWVGYLGAGFGMLVEHAAWLTSPRHEVWGRTLRGLLSRPDDVSARPAKDLHNLQPA